MSQTMTPTLPATERPSGRRSGILGVGHAALWLLLTGLSLWAIGALWFDVPIAALRPAAALLYALVALAAVIFCRRFTPVVLLVGFAMVLGWWLTLRPSNDRPWQPDVSETAWAEVEGERVTLHNVRNCEYRTETDYTPRWETRTVDLSKLRGIDLAINYWGSEWMAHPIVSFQFADAAPVCFSIETRKESGESYSAIGGLYRQYELIYICADERDVIRVRTNFRHGEDVYLFRTKASPEQARRRFLEYVATLNTLHREPRWYNATTTNCTTSIRTQHAAAQRAPWDWRVLFNGYMDRMIHERGGFAGDLPFEELKRRARINDAAQAAGDSPEFSQHIRAGRPGFATLSAN